MIKQVIPSTPTATSVASLLKQSSISINPPDQDGKKAGTDATSSVRAFLQATVARPEASRARAPDRAPDRAPAPEPTPRASTQDTVEISRPARAQLLRQQGMTLADIAQRMGLDVATVKSYFPLSL